jgi:hypothetical protein
MKLLKQIVLICALMTGSVESMAANQPEAKVMIFGVFHFANPGRDVVKTDQINVMTEENQQYLKDLAERLAAFQPTVVLVEEDPKKQTALQEKYGMYLANSFELPSNETYQLGFRVAKIAGLKSVYAFDEREVGWDAEALLKYMPENEPETLARVNTLIQEVTSEYERAHSTKSLADLLMMSNELEKDQLNKYMYLLTNHVGAGDNFVGADAAASWWHRNFRMYANIQKHAQPGARVLAIAGQGHTAILKDLLQLDRDRIAVDVRPFIFGQ